MKLFLRCATVRKRPNDNSWHSLKVNKILTALVNLNLKFLNRYAKLLLFFYKISVKDQQNMESKMQNTLKHIPYLIKVIFFVFYLYQTTASFKLPRQDSLVF